MTSPGPPHAPDDQFLRLFLQAERELLRAIMALVPNPSDAQDVLQNTAVDLWAKRADYDPSRPFAVWGYGFALNQARMFLRSEARRRARLGTVAENLLAARRVELAEELDARRDHLRRCLDALPRAQWDLVRGYYFEGCNIEELAASVGRTGDAVYKALQRTRAALMACLDRKTNGRAGK